MEIVELRSGQTPRRIEALASAPETGFIWIDIVRGEDTDWPRTVGALAGTTIHERHIADSLNPEHPSFYDGTTDYEMLVFRSLTPESEAGQFDSRATTFFLLPGFLVTVRPPDSRSIATVKERLLAGRGRNSARPVGLMFQVLHAMVDRFLALREPLAAQIDRWRGDLVDPDNPFADWLSVLAYRSQVRQLEMLCEEQEDAITGWRQNTDTDIDDHLAVRITDVLDHIRRVQRFSRDQEAEVESLVQLHFSAVAHRTNQIVRVLTILSAIFLPLTLITGIFGMNFEYMPQLKLHFGYYVTLAAMLGLAVALLLLLRVKRWL